MCCISNNYVRGARKMSKTDISVGFYSDIKKKEVKWLWYPYIPFGKITLIQGDPSEGKSMLTIKLVSLASNAGIMPDGRKMDRRINSIYQCLEDGIADTIKPRMELNGANLERIFFIKEGEDPAADLNKEKIESAIKSTKAKIFIIDPVQTILGRLGHDGESGTIREYLNMLAGIANRTGCAIILIGHLNKNENGKDLYRGLGSVDIVAAARSVLRVERIEQGSTVRVIRHIKASLSEEGEDFAFEIDENRGINWIGTINLHEEGNEIAEQSGYIKTSKYDQVKGILLELLRKEDLSYSAIQQKTKNISCVRTLNEVKKDLGIKSIKKIDGWYWHLPGKDEV